MKNLITVASLLSFAGVAFAEAPPAAKPVEKKVAPAPKPVTPAKTEAMPQPPVVEMPKPPAEVAALAKTLGGKWKCTGTSKDMANADQKVSVVVSSKVDLDKWWIAQTVDVTMGKQKDRMITYSTYDAKSSKWRRVGVGTGGGQTIGTSDGLKDNKVIYTLDVMSPYGAAQMRDTTDLTNAKAPVFTGELSMDKGKTWQPVYSVTCKR